MSKNKIISGTLTALVTPFVAGAKEVDYKSLGKLLEWQLASGVDGVVVCGSTGEAVTLSENEYQAVVRFVRENTPKDRWCIAGISTSSTQRAIEIAKWNAEMGIDALLISAPPYNKPSQAGLEAHYQAVHSAVSLPLIAYNIPGRAAISIAPATVVKMAKEGVVVAVKDASGSIDVALDILRDMPKDFSLLSGEDSLVYPMMACGGRGVISASSNVLPKEFSAMTAAALKGDLAGACKIQLEILPVVRALFCETNPVPAKAALQLKGIIANADVRLPLLTAQKSTFDLFKKLLG